MFCGNERENSMTLNGWRFKGGKSKRWRVCAIALLSFTAGSLMTARVAHIDQVRPIAITSSSFVFITLYRAKCRH